MCGPLSTQVNAALLSKDRLLEKDQNNDEDNRENPCVLHGGNNLPAEH